jgi:hypothetical protein
MTPLQTTAQPNGVGSQGSSANQGSGNDNHPGWETPGWYRFFVLPEGITVWALFLTLFAIAEQTRYTALAVKHAIHSERAWVLVTHVALVAGAIDAPEGKDQVFIQCNARNNGKTPARILGMNAVLRAGPISEPGKTWDESLYKFAQKSPTSTILPDHNTALHAIVGGYKAQPGQMVSAPCDSDETFLVHGVIRYWDMFGKEDRFTRFCFRQTDGVPGKTSTYVQAGGGRYNQQT